MSDDETTPEGQEKVIQAADDAEVEGHSAGKVVTAPGKVVAASDEDEGPDVEGHAVRMKVQHKVQH